MKRHHLLILAVLAALSLAAAGCAVGPQAVGIPVSGSSSAKLGPVYVNSLACVGLTSSGRLRIEVDSTAGVNPDYVNYGIVDEDGGHTYPMAGPVGYHFEATYSRVWKPGNCPHVSIWLGCLDPCPAWQASSQNFNYRISLVP